jgi:hypothetical protein
MPTPGLCRVHWFRAVPDCFWMMRGAA